MLLLLQRTARHRPGSPPITRVGHEAWGPFLRGWTGLWMAWLFLYVWLTLAWCGLFQIGTTATWIAADLLNLCGGFAFFYLFLVLDKPSVPAQGQPERDRGFRRALGLVGAICATAAYRP